MKKGPHHATPFAWPNGPLERILSRKNTIRKYPLRGSKPTGVFDSWLTNSYSGFFPAEPQQKEFFLRILTQDFSQQNSKDLSQKELFRKKFFQKENPQKEFFRKEFFLK